jgi:hypothetical protein
MSRVVLTIFCAVADADPIARALQLVFYVPLHLRREDVLGRDYSDAGTAERVTGTLARVAIELEVHADQVTQAVEAASGAQRRLPFRWRTVAIIDGGRVE